MIDQNQNENQNQDQSPYIIEDASSGISRMRAVGLVASGVAVCAALIGGSAFAMTAVSAPAEQSNVQQQTSNRVGQDVGQLDETSGGSAASYVDPITGDDTGVSQESLPMSDPTEPTQDPSADVVVPPVSFGGGDDGHEEGEDDYGHSTEGQSDDDSAFNAGGSTSFSGGDDADEDHADDQDSEESDD